jgi:hypothetical protein
MGIERQLPLARGKVNRIEFELPYLYHSFLAGHRLVLELNSSKFPYFARNLNTGDEVATETEMRIAHNTAHRSMKHPSHIVIPVRID